MVKIYCHQHKALPNFPRASGLTFKPTQVKSFITKQVRKPQTRDMCIRVKMSKTTGKDRNDGVGVGVFCVSNQYE